MKASIKKLLTFFSLFAAMAISMISVSAQEDEEGEEASGKMTAVFVNEHPRDEITLYWVDPDFEEDDPERLHFEATLDPRGGTHESYTFEGHEFYYEYNGEDNFVTADYPNANSEQLFVIGGIEGEGIRVRCDISINSGKDATSLDILVQPYWAPRGATRFLELVRNKYYDGVVFNRVVPNFLIQFGIGKDFKHRRDVSETAIWDDYDNEIKFEPGFISYAGSGPDSRTAEIFIVMPDTPQAQLDRFGENDWETPFGFVEGDLSVLSKIYSGYGDMPPWGKGPDSQLIYAENGYTDYLPKNFPKLDSISSCYVVDEVGLYTAEEL